MKWETNQEHATSKSWGNLKPMPEQHIVIPLNWSIPIKAMDIVRKGFIPQDMSDHWFVYCDDKSIHFYRSWSKDCIWEAQYQIGETHTTFTSLVSNRMPEQYKETNTLADKLFFMALVSDLYSGLSRWFWDGYYRLENGYRFSIDRLPHCLTIDDVVFFWGHQDRLDNVTNACLSQWWHSDFEVDGKWYNCAEQYMMEQKALLFCDQLIGEQIMTSYSPLEQKKLGRKISHFDPEIWDAVKYDIVINGNKAKFIQNKQLKEFLLSTGNKILVEASPNDNIWGIGMDSSDPAVFSPFKWNGRNLLGFALMEVRDWLNNKCE